jgi:hypothetical protein
MESPARYWRLGQEVLVQYWKPRRLAHERTTPIFDAHFRPWLISSAA